MSRLTSNKSETGGATYKVAVITAKLLAHFAANQPPDKVRPGGPVGQLGGEDSQPAPGPNSPQEEEEEEDGEAASLSPFATAPFPDDRECG